MGTCLIWPIECPDYQGSAVVQEILKNNLHRAKSHTTAAINLKSAALLYIVKSSSQQSDRQINLEVGVPRAAAMLKAIARQRSHCKCAIEKRQQVFSDG
ncbi:hypothetical protein T08_7616 [Trichinella sp. T8]|nr:hypothetical protein T08_7616 [Trichinella sp. T8]